MAWPVPTSCRPFSKPPNFSRHAALPICIWSRRTGTTHRNSPRHSARRARFTRPIIVAGNYDEARAQWVLSRGYADLVAFGRPFVANPDLPCRLANGLPLATFDASTLFGGSERGYTDHPASLEAQVPDRARDAVSFT
ncbi:hypothetical protein [Cupriavidus sp. CuC1]|uniref:oxidoreductase n=1 Tax=Cupriavidus sp. CuC1 TaxID=3373131 RepID=UPI0037D56656